MKNNKEKLDAKRVMYLLLGFVLFIYFIYTIIDNWQEYAELKKKNKSQPMVAEVYGKTAIQDLYDGSINYYVLIKDELEGKAATKLQAGQKAYVEKAVFDRLDMGDTIDGFQINGTFHNQKDLDGEYSSFYIGLSFVMVYIIGYLIYWLSKVKILRSLSKRKVIARFTDIIIKFLFLGILLTVIFIPLYFMWGTLQSAYEKLSAEDQIETTAIVTDHHFDRNSSRYADSDYYLTIAYETPANKRIYLTKQVTEHSYYKYGNSLKMPIKYTEENQYQTYLQELDREDIFQILTSSHFIMYYISLVVIVLLIFCLYLMRKRKKTGHF